MAFQVLHNLLFLVNWNIIKFKDIQNYVWKCQNICLYIWFSFISSVLLEQTTRNNDIWSEPGRSANNISPQPSVKYTQFDIFKLFSKKDKNKNKKMSPHPSVKYTHFDIFKQLFFFLKNFLAKEWKYKQCPLKRPLKV